MSLTTIQNTLISAALGTFSKIEPQKIYKHMVIEQQTTERQVGH
jgi:hypothetical protein